MGNTPSTCYNGAVTIIGTLSTDGLCPCGAPPRSGSPFCGPDCTPEVICDPDDPWGFIERAAATELARMVQDDHLDPWIHHDR